MATYNIRFRHDSMDDGQKRGGIRVHVYDDGDRAIWRDVIEALHEHGSFPEVVVTREDEVEVEL